MSKEGVKDLLEAIEPEYQTQRLREQKQATVASSLPTDTEKRKSVFTRGVETLKKGVKSYTNFQETRKQKSEQEKAEKTRIFKENRQKFLDDFKRIEELSNNINNKDSFRTNIDEILDYAEKVDNFRKRKNKRLRNDTEFSDLVLNLSKILVKSKRFFESTISREATETNSQKYKRINKIIQLLNINEKDSAYPQNTPQENPAATPQNIPQQNPAATPQNAPQNIPQNPPQPERDENNSYNNSQNQNQNQNQNDDEISICREKVSFFNIKDRRTFLQFTKKYHPDKGVVGIESEINTYIEKYPPKSVLNTMEQKQTYMFQEVSNCVDVLNIKNISSGGNKTYKKRKNNKKY